MYDVWLGFVGYSDDHCWDVSDNVRGFIEFYFSCHVSCVVWWLGLGAWVFDFFDGCSVRRGGVLAVLVLCLLCGV